MCLVLHARRKIIQFRRFYYHLGVCKHPFVHKGHKVNYIFHSHIANLSCQEMNWNRGRYYNVYPH